MSQYYYTDGKERFGPYTLEDLRGKNLTSETLIWKEGLTDWVPAKTVSDLNSLFEPAETFLPLTSAPYAPPLPATAPKNWLVESILVTILCCLPFGIVGIIHATKVEALWNTGQRDAAYTASKEAAKWVKIGLISWAICVGLYLLFIVFGVIAGFGSM